MPPAKRGTNAMNPFPLSQSVENAKWVNISGQQTNLQLMKCNFHEVTDVCDPQSEGGHTARHSGIHQMREPSPGRIAERAHFTIADHLRVQQRSERRAHELWCAGGCRHDTALSDWVQAEREVLEEFIGDYVRRHSLPRRARPISSVSFTGRKPETRILKWGRTIFARHAQSTSVLV
jgi:Protein of unknown function (DUF2934)